MVFRCCLNETSPTTNGLMWSLRSRIVSGRCLFESLLVIGYPEVFGSVPPSGQANSGVVHLLGRDRFRQHLFQVIIL